MDTDTFIGYAKDAIMLYYHSTLKTGINLNDIYVVWNCKTLQNNKALLSTTIPDTRYFEITYNGDKKELYFDSYTKECNKCIKV